MNLSEIKKLIRLFESSKVSELEVEQEGLRIQMKKGAAAPAREVVHVSAPPVAESAAQAAAPAPAERPKPKQDSRGHVIKAPMVGTFFRAPSPTSPHFVEEGDIVRKGDVLCIIEAMKLMNEIESDIEGKIVTIFPENGKPVEYGEPLFEIEPQ